MSKKEDLVKKTMELIARGKSEEEIKKALESLVSEAQASAPRALKDRVEYFKTAEDLTRIRKEIKTAFASKAKMRSNPQAVERYEKQIKAGQYRLAELQAQALASEDPIQALIKLNEEPSALLQQWIILVEERVRGSFGEEEFSKAGLRRAAGKLGWTTPGSATEELKERLGEKALEYYEARAKNGDQRVRTLNRLIRLSEMAPAERKKLADPEKAVNE